MKKSIKILIILTVIILIIPQISLAAWWNPLSWNIWNLFDKNKTSHSVQKVKTKETQNIIKTTKKIIQNNITPTTTILKNYENISEIDKYNQEQIRIAQKEAEKFLIEQKESEKIRLENEEKVKQEIAQKEQKETEEKKVRQANADLILAQLDSNSRYLDNKISLIEQQIVNKKAEIEGLHGRGTSLRLVEGKIAQIEAKYGDIENQLQSFLLVKQDLSRMKYKIEYWASQNIPLTTTDIDLLASWGIEL